MRLIIFKFLALRLLCFVWSIVPVTRAQPSPPPCTHRYDTLFDFETASEVACFHGSPGTVTQSAKTTNPVTVKHGSYSLKWEPRSGSLNPNLKLKFSSGSEIPTDWLRRGGVKVWFYKERPSLGKTLKVEFKNSGILVATFTAHLAFEGWRGVWVKFQECKVTSTSLDRPTKVDEVNFVLRETDTIYIDLLQFVRSMAKQSRDKVVPPISPFGLDLYDPSSTWQMTYKWSQQTIPPSPPTIDVSKKISFEMIESRLNNWYCDEAKSTVKFPAGSFLEKRWNSLAGPFRKAHRDYDALDFDSSHRVIGPPLFCRDCRYPKKFGEIMEKMLFRLSLEYYIRSRIPEIRDTVAAYLNDLNTPAAKDSACKAIAGRDRNMVRKFKSYLPASGSISSEQVENAIKQLNIHRLNKINNLLDYVKQQGLADGSGLGCLDHEWNVDGAGFMHSLFLLKDSLRKPENDARLLDLIKTAKWYNDFGEIYQSPTFEIRGTTADRMITLMLFRLMIVLIMPSNTDDDFKAKIRDMDALVRWMNNALAVNEGLGGVIKPDFVGHHHKAFYGSAYVPQALHTAALVHYLLEGTAFALSASSENNIRRGLETMRIIAVKYSTPNSVNGRMPNYANKLILKGLLPAFAYISVSHPLTGPSEIAGGCVASANKPEMFLRLYKDPSVNSYLEDGGHKRKYYYNSLGSLDIMEAVKTIAENKGINPESSPEGHWSKNFAVLSIHRRKDWAVTVKGFNSFLWDFEKANDENVFGMFGSHGALLIANSETNLEAHDVENGWDWAKVPGATTIALETDPSSGTKNFDDLKLPKGRFYNPKNLAGGLTFKGTSTLKNGVFGMDFEQPTYKLKAADWRHSVTFEFKKSVFFFENLLVCTGSDISASHTAGRIVQTTLFQDKITGGVSIKINGAVTTSAAVVNPSVPGQLYTTLTDTKGNFYYIPGGSKSLLKVHAANQDSWLESGAASSPTTGIYGTAWFDHGDSPSGTSSEYEYAVLIPTTSYDATPTDLTTAQQPTGSKVYQVLQKDDVAHIVQFQRSTKSSPPSTLSHSITGYVLFPSAAPVSLTSLGPLAEVNSGDCLIMVEETSEFIHLSISSPSLNLARKSGATPLTNSDDVGQAELYQSSSREREIEVTLRKKVQKSFVSLQTHGNPDSYKANVWVDTSGLKVTFPNLKNGFSVEVQLKKSPVP